MALTIATLSADAAPLHAPDTPFDFTACTARAAAQLDDGRPDFAPIARAVAAACRDSYRNYLRYMGRAHPAEPVPSDRDLAISAVQYERKYGPAPLAARRLNH
jgi:hypothetical protein